MSLYTGLCHQCGESCICTKPMQLTDICEDCEIANQTEWYLEQSSDWQEEKRYA